MMPKSMGFSPRNSPFGPSVWSMSLKAWTGFEFLLAEDCSWVLTTSSGAVRVELIVPAMPPARKLTICRWSAEMQGSASSKKPKERSNMVLGRGGERSLDPPGSLVFKNNKMAMTCGKTER